MDGKITYQKLTRRLSSKDEKASVYYMLISVLNGLKFTEREIELISFTVNESQGLLDGICRTRFCERYNTSLAVINNMVAKLKKINVFVKKGGEIRVNPVIVMDFDKDVRLELNLIYDGKDS